MEQLAYRLKVVDDSDAIGSEMQRNATHFIRLLLAQHFDASIYEARIFKLLSLNSLYTFSFSFRQDFPEKHWSGSFGRWRGSSCEPVLRQAKVWVYWRLTQYHPLLHSNSFTWVRLQGWTVTETLLPASPSSCVLFPWAYSTLTLSHTQRVCSREKIQKTNGSLYTLVQQPSYTANSMVGWCRYGFAI